MSWFETMRDLGIDAAKRLDPWFNAARVSGWAWLYWDIAIITDRALSLNVDERGRLHGEHGPAVEFADGLQVWAWHGTRVPANWITHRAALDPRTALTEPNMERRLAAAQIIGWDKVLATVPHRVIDTDPDPKFGQLISADLPDAPDTRFLRARCGTGRDVVVRVSREAETAVEAGAMSYGVPVAVYRLIPFRT